MKKSRLFIILALALTAVLITSSVVFMSANANEPVGEKTVESIEVVGSSIQPIIELCGGYWSTWYNPETQNIEEMFYYPDYNLLEGAQIKLTFTDGTTETVGYYNERGYVFSCGTNQFTGPWHAGGNNILTVYLGEISTNYNVTLIETPLESIEIAGAESFTLYENGEGEWKTRTDPETQLQTSYFEYSIRPIITGYEYKLTFKDGREVVTEGGLWSLVDGYSFGFTDTQSTSPWIVGGNNILTVYIMGKYYDVPVEIIPNPVESLEIIENTLTPVYENVDCGEREIWNDVTERWELVPWYEQSIILRNAQVKVNYKDGTFDIFSFYGNSNTDYLVTWSTNQDEVRWTAGGNNKITVSYLGITDEIIIPLLPNPVKSIEIDESTLGTLIEGFGGNNNSRYDETLGQWVEYYEYQIDNIIQNTVINVTLADDSVIYLGAYDSYLERQVEIYTNQYEQPWSIGGNNLLTITLFGISDTANVIIEEYPIESIEAVEGVGTLTEYTYGYWSTRYNSDTDTEEPFFFYEDYFGVFNDLLFKITYKDGHEEYFSPHGYSMRHNQYESPWGAGGDNNIVYIEFELDGIGTVEAEIKITIIESNVESIEIVEGTVGSLIENSDGIIETRYDEELESTVEYYCYEPYPATADTMVKITFKGGETETVLLYEGYEGESFSITHRQEEKPWTVGGENILSIGFKGAWCEVNIEIEPNPVESIEVVDGTLGFIVEGSYGYTDMRYDDELDEWVEYFCYEYDRILNDTMMRINYKDGTHKIVSIHQEVDGRHFFYGTNQNESPWVIGGNNLLFIEYMGAKTQVAVTVNPNPIDRIELAEESFTPLIENCDGYWNYRYNYETNQDERYFHYDWEQALNNALFKVYYKDGTDDTVRANIWSYYDDQERYPWTVGGENKANIEIDIENIGTAELTLSIPITECPVQKIELVDTEAAYLYEYANGYQTYRYDSFGNSIPYFRYEYDIMANRLRFRVTYKDGSTELVKPYFDYNGRQIQFYEEQELYPWVIDGDNKLYASYLGYTLTIDITVRPNPVESIEWVENTLSTLTQYADAHKSYYYDEYLGGETFFYEYDPYNALKKAKIKINFTDGTSKTMGVYDSFEGYQPAITPSQSAYLPWDIGGNNKIIVDFFGFSAKTKITIVPTTIGSIEVIDDNLPPLIKNTNGMWDTYYDSDEDKYVDYFYYYTDTVYENVKLKITFRDGSPDRIIGMDEVLNGYTPDCYADQFATPWTVDGENIITFYFMGIEAEYSVKIIESPVESITVNSIDFGDIYYNDPDFGYVSGGKFYISAFFQDISFTVNYKDGTVKTYAMADAAESEYDTYFGGYPVYLNFGDEPAVIGKNKATLEYMGAEAEFDINVIEPLVEYIKVIKLPAKTDYIQKKETYNNSLYKFLPILDGIDFEIKYNNGSVVKASEVMTDCYYYFTGIDYVYVMELGEKNLYVGVLDDSYDGYVASFCGQTCKLDFLEYSEGMYIVDMTVNTFKKNGNGMEVTLLYSDETTETITLDTIATEVLEQDGVILGLAKCEKGIFFYTIVNYDGGKNYIVYMLGIETLYTLEVETGDADGDGEINANDAIHLLYAVLFGTNEYELSQTCDFDGDGNVDADDAIYLLYTVLFGEDDYPLYG